MKSKSILALFAIAAFAMTAQATTYTWFGGASGDETNWSNENNWRDQAFAVNGYPHLSGDTATIGDRTYDPVLNDGGITNIGTITINNGGQLTQNSTLTVGTITVNTGGTYVVGTALNVGTLTVDGTMTMNADVIVTSSCTIGDGGVITTGAYTLTISGSGGLDIQAGGTLDVNHGSGKVVLSGGGTHYISSDGTNVGQMYLRYSGSTLRIEDNDATISYNDDYPGQIVGENNSAVIEMVSTVASAPTFTSEVDIVGALQIKAGSGAFLNHGLVNANTSGTLELYSGTIDDSSGAVRWHADTNSSAVLRFSVTATGLEGDFRVEDDAQLAFYANVTTTGTLYMYCLSDIDMGNSATFTRGSYTGDCSSTPPNPMTSDFTCSCP